jgi:NAD(P)-dependent dehydrogenase (short-subunit alcohol dehydrogenase family)
MELNYNHYMRKTSLLQDPAFSGKNIVVTGASAGIGYRTTLEFCRRGAFVIGTGRSSERCRKAQEDITREVPGANIHFLIADLSRQQEIHRLAGDISKTLEKNKQKGLDVLVNNAGTFMDKLVLTEDGVETTIAVNHVAPFLLTNLLMPLMSKSSDGRVITVSSDSHYRTFLHPESIRKPAIFISLWQYKVSKLANILFTLEFNRRHSSTALHAFAVDPGLVNTDIGLKGTDALSGFIWRLRQKKGVDPIEPATTILFLSSDAEAPKSPAVYWHDSAPKEPSRAALDSDLARRLWEESGRICQIATGLEEA